MATMAGCTSPRPHVDPATTQDFAELWGRPAYVESRAQTVQLAGGLAPLVYMTQGDEVITIADDAGHRWGPVSLPARSIVRVSEETGVGAGGVELYHGRLQAGRRYTISVDIPDVSKPPPKRAAQP
jgi:hypothetical protein